MSSISEIYRVRQRAIEHAIKHNNNSKAAVKYKNITSADKTLERQIRRHSPISSAKKQKT